jgi:hypothetical protein
MTVIKSLPGNMAKFFAKQHGGKEYPLPSGTDLAAETLLMCEEITEEQYNNY